MRNRRSIKKASTATPRQMASWQRALVWLLWITFIVICAINSGRSSMEAQEFAVLFVAGAVHVACANYPAGRPRVEIRSIAELRGEFVSSANWVLVLMGFGMTLMGVAMCRKLWYDLATGGTTLWGVVEDCLLIAVEMFRESASGGTDGDVTHTQLYVLVLLAPIGVITTLVNLLPWTFSGVPFRIGSDGQISIRQAGNWVPLQLAHFGAAAIDNLTIELTDPQPGHVLIRLPRARVYSRQVGALVRPQLLGQFFREKLQAAGFQAVESAAVASTETFVNRARVG